VMTAFLSPLESTRQKGNAVIKPKLAQREMLSSNQNSPSDQPAASQRPANVLRLGEAHGNPP